jgi:hypothetical protein
MEHENTAAHIRGIGDRLRCVARFILQSLKISGADSMLPPEWGAS